MCFYENATYKANSDITKSDVDAQSTCSSTEQSNSNDDMVFKEAKKCKGQFCQRVQTVPHKTLTPKKDAKCVPSQIIIVSSKELPLSSDESSTIDVGSEIDNPWGNMDINDIPIEIVDNLNFSEDDEPEITKDYKGCDILFEPLNDQECRVVALKFNLVINESSHPVSFIGIGNTCPCPPHDNSVCKTKWSLSLQLIFTTIVW